MECCGAPLPHHSTTPILHHCLPRMPVFRLFGPDHLAALGVLLLLGAATGCWGRRFPEPHRRFVRRTLAQLLVGYAVAAVWRSRMAGASWLDCLPLHLCDIVLI